MKTFLILTALSFLPVSALAGGSTSAGIGNPSANICKTISEQKHIGVVKVAAQNMRTLGESGYCRFEDGSIMEQWELFRSGIQNSLATKFFFASQGVGNWKLSEERGWTEDNKVQKYCEYVGGQLENYRERLRQTSLFVMCSFSDSSMIDVGSLYWGTDYAPTLASYLQSPIERDRLQR